jgi:hypothetical protein
MVLEAATVDHAGRSGCLLLLLRLGAGEAATIAQQPGSGGLWIHRRPSMELSYPFAQCKNHGTSNGQYDEEAGSVLDDHGEAGKRKGKILYGSPHAIVTFKIQGGRLDVLHGLLQVNN